MIRTARLTLRPARAEDLAALHRVFSDPRAMRYWSSLPHTRQAQTAKTLQNMQASHTETGAEFVVVRAGDVIGKAGLWRMAEIGFILHPGHWGSGLGREAAQAVITHAFARHPGLDAITADTDPRNAAAARLLANLGFAETHRESGTFKLGEEWCDSQYWRLARPISG